MPKPPTGYATFLDIETEGAFQFLMDPKWPVVELALRALNGKSNSLVCIEGPKPANLTIAGGGPLGCVVSLTYTAEEYFVLQFPEHTSELVELEISGSKGLYPKSMLVPLEMALAAAMPFTATGVANPALPWVGSADIHQPNAAPVQEEAGS